MERRELSAKVERLWIGLMRAAPLGAYTRLIRTLGAIPLPRAVRAPVFGAIAERMGMNLAEAEGTLADYRCFRDLFARPLRGGVRPVDDAPGVGVAPVDGTVGACGQVHQGGLVQAKGIDYGLADLLQSPDLAGRLDGGSYVTLYLRPRDYHRIHSPVDGRVLGVRRVPGRLLPVQPTMVRGLRGLFVHNERLVIELDGGELGRIALVCVAAAGVGNIGTRLALDPRARGVNGRGALVSSVGRGEELARFNLGSTVITIFEAGIAELAPLAVGQQVRMGQALAVRVGNRAR